MTLLPIETPLPSLSLPVARPGAEYVELRRLLTERGLFRRRPVYSLASLLMFTVLFGLAVGLLFLTSSLVVVLLDAVFLAFVFTQIGYLGHDAGHRQIFGRPVQNDFVLLFIGVLTGASLSWWCTNHNRHHSDPNGLGVDPHTAIPALAFSYEERLSKQGWLRTLTRFQAFYFFPMLLFQGLGVHLASAMFLMGPRARYRRLEALGMGLHAVLAIGLLLLALPWWQAGLFIVVQQSLMGLYMGSVFAPNHKGMLVIEGATDLDFFHRQVLTTRNLKPNPLTDFWYGGLCYQIEHHLFPNLPRHNLRRAQPLVRAFCRERGVPYAEVGVRRSFVLVTSYLDRVARGAASPT